MLYDAHCHPTEHPETLAAIPSLEATLCLMATNLEDLDLVRGAAGPNAIPAFGLHPWFAHLVSFGGCSKPEHYLGIFGAAPDAAALALLPEPVPIEAHLARIEAALNEFPEGMVGEIGLDKAFRVRIGGELSPYKTSMEHQRRVFRRQLELAARLGRAASVHGVQCHMPLLEECTAVAKEFRGSQMRICLHSFSGTPDFASQRWTRLPLPVYFSVSVLVNSRNRQKTLELVRALPKTRLLSESDHSRAGEQMLTLLEESLELLAAGGVTRDQVERNFWAFVGRREAQS